MDRILGQGPGRSQRTVCRYQHVLVAYDDDGLGLPREYSVIGLTCVVCGTMHSPVDMATGQFKSNPIMASNI